jgi:hypothetical protein
MLMRYVAILALTVLLLGIARRISTRHPAAASLIVTFIAFIIPHSI